MIINTGGQFAVKVLKVKTWFRFLDLLPHNYFEEVFVLLLCYCVALKNPKTKQATPKFAILALGMWEVKRKGTL